MQRARGLTSFSAVRRINKRRRTVSGPVFRGPPSRRRSFVLANRTRVPARPFRKNARNVQSYNARPSGLSFWILAPPRPPSAPFPLPFLLVPFHPSRDSRRPSLLFSPVAASPRLSSFPRLPLFLLPFIGSPPRPPPAPFRLPISAMSRRNRPRSGPLITPRLLGKCSRDVN